MTCNCEHEENFCVLEEGHVGICGDGEIVWMCRDRDDYPHGLEEPAEPFLGPGKSRHIRKGPKKTLGDYLRTKKELTHKKIQEVLQKHPDLELPEWLPEGLRAPRRHWEDQTPTQGRLTNKGGVEGL